MLIIEFESGFFFCDIGMDQLLDQEKNIKVCISRSS